MKKKKSIFKIFIVVISILAVIFIGYFAYTYYKKLKEPTTSVFKAIPENTAFIIELRNANNLYSQLNESNFIWNSLKQISSFDSLTKQIEKLDSLIQGNVSISTILENQSVYISTHFAGFNKFEYLYLVSLPNTRQNKIINSFIGENKIISTSKHNGAKINTIQIEGFEEKFFYSVYKGLFIGSFNELLIQNSIDRVNSGNSMNDDSDFQKVSKIASDNVEGTVYLNFKYFYRFLSKYALPTHRNNINPLSYFARWSKLDLTIKDNSILLNGYTIISDSGDYQLGLFKTQSPQKIEFTRVLPQSTSFFLYTGFENFKEYYGNFKKLQKGNNIELDKDKTIDELNKKYSVNLQNSLFSWVKNEMALVITYDGGSNIADNSYLIFKSVDIKEAKQALDQLSLKIHMQNESPPDTNLYRTYDIKRLDVQAIFPLFFGSLYQNIQGNFYTSIDDYIVFANSEAALIRYIDSYMIERTLARDQNYMAFSNNISGEANLYLYCNIKKSLGLLSNYLDEDYSQIISDNQSSFRNFEAIGIQFLMGDEMCYTNLNLWHNQSAEEEKVTSWETALDANFYDKPYLVTDHNTKTKKIIVFDVANFMYLLSEGGDILWKIPLLEKPMSEVHIVDCYNNGKFQYLFNTENYIYLVDLNGNFVDNFPVKLEAKATNGISVFDYENNKDYRLLVACTDKKIYNYQIDGSLTKGWDSPEYSSVITKPIQHLTFKGKDFIVVADTIGDVIFCNRRGEPRIEAKLAFTNSVNSEFYCNDNKNDPKMLTTDKSGRIVFISHNGEVEKKLINEFSSKHEFLYVDFNGDNLKDFVFSDDNTIFIYNYNFELLLKQKFDDEILPKPIYIPNSANGPLLGVISKTSRQIIFINKDGILKQKNNLFGDSPFVSKLSKTDGHLYIITASGKIIYNYLVD
ncbi:MAG: DUF3352 domain-containing protein [Saprospiraceae bacterium]|nr:DUF3352 domain-containing protein [Saprospiraceae bacterium]